MKRIFLVEDDQAIAKNLTLLLRAEGFTVTHAPTRGDALAVLAGNKFDLALVDISLLKTVKSSRFSAAARSD